jgi:hypothetical protein
VSSRISNLTERGLAALAPRVLLRFLVLVDLIVFVVIDTSRWYGLAAAEIEMI